MPEQSTTAKSSLYCRRCGAKADQRDRFCRVCGTRLEARERLEKPASLVESVPQIPPRDVEASVRQLESEKEALKKFRRMRLEPSRIITYSLLIIGAVALVSSVVFVSSILALIGLGITFWGALFLFIRPVAYVKAKLLDSTAVSSLIAIGQILSEEGYQGKCLYLAPKNEEGFKGGMVFISANNGVAIPSMDEITRGKVFLENPRGVCLLSPGYGLAKLFEEELGVDFSQVDVDYLRKSLPKLLVEDLEVVGDFSMNVDGEFVEVRMVSAIYRDLCREVKKHTNICLHLGCPICSAIGCVLAEVTGNPVVFEGDKLSGDGTEIQARYRTIKG